MNVNSSGVVTGKTPSKVKKVILVKELDNVLYALAVRTSTDIVYDRKYQYTLTELLDDIQKALTTTSSRLTKEIERFDILMKDCPEEANTLKKIWDYINVENKDEEGNPVSALIKLIESKISKEDGKGLSTHDLTDLLYQKLINDYTKDELDEKFEIITNGISDISDRTSQLEQTANVHFTDSPDIPECAKEGSIWFQIISKDANTNP